MNCTETELALTADDGFVLSARRFDPVGGARGGVVIHGATATPRRYYDRFARWLAAQGFRVLTYDYRGVGGSRPRSLRGFVATNREWGERDAVAAVRHLRAQGPDAPLLMVGHSFGGQCVGLSDALTEVDAAVMVGVQFAWAGHWPQPTRALFSAVWRGAFPAASALFGYVPGWLGIGEDLPSGVALEWARWARSPRYFVDAVPGAAGRFASLRAPVLFYSFTDDTYAPSGAVRHYLGAIHRARVTHRRLRPEDVGARAIGHFGFFREEHAGTLWPEVARFFTEVVEGRATSARPTTPSGCFEAPDERELLSDLAFGRE